MDEIKFSLDTFYALMSGALVMWMAAGNIGIEDLKKKIFYEITKNS